MDNSQLLHLIAIYRLELPSFSSCGLKTSACKQFDRFLPELPEPKFSMVKYENNLSPGDSDTAETDKTAAYKRDALCRSAGSHV